MTATLAPTPVFQWINSQGQPLIGGQLFSYQAGTSTLLPTYTDATGSVANTNPVILDANGSWPVWLGSANYKLVLKDNIGNVIWTIDNINASQGAYLSTLGGTVYNPGNNTAIIINADTGFSSGITLQVGGVNSALVSSPSAGQFYVSEWNGSAWVTTLTLNSTTGNFFGTAFAFGSNTTAAPAVVVNGAAGSQRLNFWSTASVPRWQAGATGGAETGSNAGSDFSIGAWSDGGSFLAQAAICTRATQAWNFPVSVTSPSITDTSDVRLKDLGKRLTLDEAWVMVNPLEPVHFEWKSNHKKGLGLPAQKVREVIPEITEEDANGYLSVAYQKLVCPLLVIIKDQERRIKELEAKL